MRFRHRSRPFRGILDARETEDDWLLLRAGGSLATLNGRLVGGVDPADLREPLELHVSAKGRFAAVVERFGRFGHVYDLLSGERTMVLDRGEYLPEYSVFPLDFIERDGRTWIVHGTDWNRLDVSDALSGRCLTERGPSNPVDGEPTPPQFLDYFHAGLQVSPGGRWIAEDGWIWHPLGEVRVWSLADWVDGSVWESEDGASIRRLADRVYFWDTPMAWLDADRLAVWGDGHDGDSMCAVIRIFDVAQGRETARIEGPEVAPAMPWPPGSARKGWLTFDRWLFAVSPERGTGVWDVESGARLHLEAGFAPRRYGPRRREFLAWTEDEVTISHLVESP